MIKGSCCCGAISFELSEPPAMMGCCHCSRCRKVGASTIVFVRSDTFRWIGGEEMVQRYPAVPPYKYDRCFCSCCGTALGEPGGGDSFPINANCLDDDPQVRVQFHEFVAEKPAWAAICDAAPQYLGHPVSASRPVSDIPANVAVAGCDAIQRSSP